jgi:PleD family two-component response regulator
MTYLRPEDTVLGAENSAVDLILARADGALYEAKQSGRNCLRTH